MRTQSAVLPVLVMALSAWVVRAQESEPPKEPPPPELGEAIQDVVYRMKTVVLSATRSVADPYDVPATVVVYEPRDVGRTRVLQDALEGTSGVHVQRTSYGQTSPYVRGLTGYHTLLMIDGIRVNNSVWRSGPNEYWGLVDGLSLERLELVLGPSSVLYGSDAVAGALNAIPLRRRTYGESSWDRRLHLRVSTAEQSISGRAQISGNVGNDFGFVLGTSGGAFGDLDAGGDVGRQSGTHYHNVFADGAFDIPLDEHWTLGILAQIARVRDVNRIHATQDGVPFHGTVVGSDRSRKFAWDRDLVALSLDGAKLGGAIDDVKVRLSWQRLEETQNRRRNNGRVELSGFDVDTLGFSLQLASSTSIGRLTYGIDYYHDFIDSFRNDFAANGTLTVRIQGPVGDRGDYDLLGVFLQDEIPLGDRLTATLAARFTYAAADIGRVEDPATGLPISLEDHWFDVLGSARLLWRALDELHLWGGISQSFRAPNLSDLSRLDTARTNEIEIPSAGLDPERFITFEIGAKTRFFGLSGELTYFYTLVDDLIIRQPTGMMVGGSNAVLKRNAGDGHIQGLNLTLGYDFDDQWALTGTFAWTDGQIETFPTSAPVKKEEGLDKLAPIQGRVALRWQTPDTRFWVKGSALLVHRQDRLTTADRRDTQRIPPGGTPGYVIWNLDAGFRIDERSEVFLSLENLLDKNYRVHGSGVQEPGFNAILGADITF